MSKLKSILTKLTSVIPSKDIYRPKFYTGELVIVEDTWIGTVLEINSKDKTVALIGPICWHESTGGEPTTIPIRCLAKYHKDEIILKLLNELLNSCK